MKRSSYKVIEETIFPNLENETVVIKGTLEECKEYVRGKYSSSELLDYLKDEGVDIKEFIISYFYDSEENEVILPDGKIVTLERLKSFSEDNLRDIFTSSELGCYGAIIGEGKLPIVFKYGYTEEG